MPSAVAPPANDARLLAPTNGDASTMIELTDVGCRYGTEPPVIALRNIDLTVRAGEWVAVVGPSGSGKSSLLNILGCLSHQTSGTYRLRGYDVATLTDRQRAGLRSRHIGFVFQSFHLLAHRTVLENVMLAELYCREPRAGRADRAREGLTSVGLADRVDFLPTRLSGGERQRVAIARALLHKPELMLCDEPTGNLDSATTTGILGLLGALNDRGLTIVMITHDADVAARAERQIRLIDGRIRTDV